MEEFNAKIITSGNQIQECDHPVREILEDPAVVSQDRKRNLPAHHAKSITNNNNPSYSRILIDSHL